MDDDHYDAAWKAKLDGWHLGPCADADSRIKTAFDTVRWAVQQDDQDEVPQTAAWARVQTLDWRRYDENIDDDDGDGGGGLGVCPFCTKPLSIFPQGRQAHLALCSGIYDD
jgi:hypothetical protein